MSAVNVFVNSRRACLLTDSTIYAPDGTIVAFENKAYAIDSWTGAVTGRGNWWGPTFTRDLAETFASFDEFLVKSSAIIEQHHCAALAAEALEGQPFVEIHVIGWSELRDQAEACVLRSPRPGLDTSEPTYVWCDLAEEDGIFLHAQFNAEQQWQLHRQGAEADVDWTAETFDPIRHGIPLMEAQRREPAGPEAGEGIAGKHIIGGELWLTVVDRDGVRQGIILDWADDRVGEPIRPDALDESKLPKIPPSGLAAAWTFERFDRAIKAGIIEPATFAHDKARLAQFEGAAPVSRQQRRAAKAQARKMLAHGR